MIRLYDNKRKQWFEVPDNEVADKVGSGEYTPEAGIELPVIDPDGNLASIKSEEAQLAFKEGYRLPTATTQAAAVERRQQEIRRENFDDTGVALAGGLLSGATLGTSDLALRVGEETGILPEGVIEARKASQEMSPTASLVGEGLGALATIASPTGGAAFAKLGTGVTDAVKALNVGKKVKSLGTSASTARLAGNIAEKTALNAAEGAFIGAGTGISEASLGRPEDIVENLASNIGMGVVGGALVGGAFGAAGGAVPRLRAMAEATGDVTQNLINRAAKKGMGLAVPVARLSGRADDAVLAKEILDLPDYARRYISDNPDLARTLVKDAKTTEKALAAETAASRKALDLELSRMTNKEIPRVISESLERQKGDISAALKETYDESQELYTALKSQLDEARAPAQIMGDLSSKLDDTVKVLEKSGVQQDNALARTIQDYHDAVVPSKFQSQDLTSRSAALSQAMTEGQELAAAWELKKMLYKTDLGSLSQKGRDAIDNLTKEVRDRFLHNHPNQDFAQAFKHIDDYYQSFIELRKLATGKSTSKGAMKSAISDRVLKTALFDPEKAPAFDRLLTNASAYSADFANIAKSQGNIRNQADALNQLKKQILDREGASVSSQLTDDDLLDLVGSLTKNSNRGAKLDRLRNLKDLSAELEGATTADKYLKIKSALGQDIAKEIKELLPHFNIISKLEKSAARADGDVGAAIKGLVTRGGVGATVGSMLGGSEGAALGGATGVVLGSNPARLMKMLRSVEKANKVAAQAVESSIKATTSALTSPKATRAVNTFYSRPSIKERRKEYPKVAERLAALQDPKQMADFIEDQVGESVAPQIQSAAGAKIAEKANFLFSKLPTDPFAGNTLFGNNTGWVPSDAELDRFSRYVTAAEQPLSVVERIGSGTVTSEELETIQVLYPKLYSDLQSSVLNAIMEPDAKVSYRQRVIIGSLFNAVTDPSMDPLFILAMQKQGTQDQGGRPEEGPTTPKKTSKLDLPVQDTMTDTQRVTYK